MTAFPPRRLRSLAGLALGVLTFPPPWVADTVYLSEPVKTKRGAVPACTALVVAEDAGKLITLEQPEGPWGRFTAKASSLESGHDSFGECLRATERYAEAFEYDQLLRYDGSGLLAGMPLEFADMLLGPRVSARDMSDDDPHAHEWRPATGELAPISNITAVRSAAAWRLRSANSVGVYTGTHGEIRFMIVSEDRTAPRTLDDLGDAIVDPWARYSIGMAFYDQGDAAGAFRVWLPLAQQDRPDAQYSVGDLYYRGEGTGRDLAEAVRWFRAAAENSYPAAQYHLAYLYAAGEGVERDLIQAYQWMAAAEALEFEGAAGARESLASKMSPEELARAVQLVESADVTAPVLVRSPPIAQPEFPEPARVMRAAGQVVIEAVIGTTGNVERAKVVRVSRTGLGFENSALKAVMQWRYRPATRGGEPIEVFFTVVVDYSVH